MGPAHHRTTGEPGQGVDGRLLCPVINKPSPKPPPGGLSTERRGCGKRAFGGGGRMKFSRGDERSDPLKAATTLVPPGPGTKAQNAARKPNAVPASPPQSPTSADPARHDAP